MSVLYTILGIVVVLVIYLQQSCTTKKLRREALGTNRCSVATS